MPDTDIETLTGGDLDDIKAAFRTYGFCAVGRGALVKPAADIVNPTVPYIIAWDSEAGGYDTDSCHDNVTNNSRLLVPSGWSWVRVGCQVQIGSITSLNNAALNIRKTQTGTGVHIAIGMPFTVGFADTGSNALVQTISPPLQVTGGTDYFDVRYTSADTTFTITAAGSFFWIELLG